jgi:hypothetical protein
LIFGARIRRNGGAPVKSFFLPLLLLLVVPAIGQENGLAQSKADLVGTWKLISATETTKKGEVRTEAFGKNSAGLITYTADGLVMAIITNGATSTAYAGRYTLDGDKVIHHIEVASLQNIVNTDLVRLIKLKGNSLSLRTINMAIAGAEIAYREFVWERISNN